jgi:hypothetical protein
LLSDESTTASARRTPLNAQAIDTEKILQGVNEDKALGKFLESDDAQEREEQLQRDNKSISSPSNSMNTSTKESATVLPANGNKNINGQVNNYDPLNGITPPADGKHLIHYCILKG